MRKRSPLLCSHRFNPNLLACPCVFCCPSLLQHNIRVVAKAYSRITFDRLCSLLGLDRPTTEASVAELVSDGAL